MHKINVIYLFRKLILNNLQIKKHNGIEIEDY